MCSRQSFEFKLSKFLSCFKKNVACELKERKINKENEKNESHKSSFKKIWEWECWKKSFERNHIVCEAHFGKKKKINNFCVFKVCERSVRYRLSYG